MTPYGEILVEVVIRKKQIKCISENIQFAIDTFKQFETDDKIVLEVPESWAGFRDGTIVSMFKTFGEALYLALAYFTDDREEIVTDLVGMPIDRYEVTFKGKRVDKYVKKRLRILKILDKEKNSFKVFGYELDMKYTSPAVQVLEVYSGGLNSGVSLKEFLPESNSDNK